jgi:hypothetical protein
VSALCPSRGCGCAIVSTTLDVDVVGDSITIEMPDAYAEAYPIFTFANATERDAELPVGVRQEGMEAFLRDEFTKYRFVGGAWVPISRGLSSYTPTLSSFTLGSGGTNQCRYMIADGMVTVWFRFVLGTGFTISNPSWSLPVSMAAGGTALRFFTGGLIYDATALAMYGLGGEIASSGTAIAVYCVDASDGKSFPLSSTNPVALAAGDEIWGSCSYPIY